MAKRKDENFEFLPRAVFAGIVNFTNKIENVLKYWRGTRYALFWECWDPEEEHSKTGVLPGTWDCTSSCNAFTHAPSMPHKTLLSLSPTHLVWLFMLSPSCSHLEQTVPPFFPASLFCFIFIFVLVDFVTAKRRGLPFQDRSLSFLLTFRSIFKTIHHYFSEPILFCFPWQLNSSLALYARRVWKILSSARGGLVRREDFEIFVKGDFWSWWFWWR